jgi:hypothetical protein
MLQHLGVAGLQGWSLLLAGRGRKGSHLGERRRTPPPTACRSARSRTPDAEGRMARSLRWRKV